jgi:hypothetical protein
MLRVTHHTCFERKQALLHMSRATPSQVTDFVAPSVNKQSPPASMKATFSIEMSIGECDPCFHFIKRWFHSHIDSITH